MGMKIDFCGGSYKTFSTFLNAQECINFMPQIDLEGGKEKISLRGTPGLLNWCNTGNFAEVRGLKRFLTHLFAIVGNKAFRVDKDGNSTECTGNLLTTSNKVSMAVNDTQVMIVDGKYGYIIEGTTLTRITDAGFPSKPLTVTEKGRYFIVNVAGSGRGYVSDIYNGLSWNATNFFNAEGDVDNTLAVFTDHKDVIMFGEKSMEPFYQSSSTVPFDVKPGYFQEVGLGAIHSPAKNDNTVFWLTDKFQIARLEGGNPKVVSPPSVDYQLSQYSKISDAVGMGMTIEGNPLYILNFKDANATWCYNARTNYMHQLASYPSPYTGRWRGNCAESFDGNQIIGDYENGVLYKLDFDTFKDNSQTIKRVRTAPAIFKDGRYIFHNSLSIFFEHGIGLVTGQGSDPKAMLRFSDNGCKTWNAMEIWRSVGKIGEYNIPGCKWNRLGRSISRNYQLTVTDPNKWVITGAYLEADIAA